MLKFKNTFYLFRHGETESNTKEILSSSDDSANHFPLTARGVDEVERAIRELTKEHINRLVSSPLLRSRQSATLVGEAIQVPIEIDDRLREVAMGIFNHQSYRVYHDFFRIHEHSFDVPIPGGESWRQVAARMRALVEEIDRSCQNAHILLVSHEDPLALLDWSVRFTDPKDFEKARFLKTGEWMELNSPTRRVAAAA